MCTRPNGGRESEGEVDEKRGQKHVERWRHRRSSGVSVVGGLRAIGGHLGHLMGAVGGA